MRRLLAGFVLGVVASEAFLYFLGQFGPITWLLIIIDIIISGFPH